MADDVDRAKEREMMHRDLSLDAQLNKPECNPGEEPFEVEGVRVCLDCFVEIPAARLKAKPDAMRCVDCKEIWETRNR